MTPTLPPDREITMPEPSSITLAGSGLCSSSALLGVITGDSPIVIGLGIATGVALGLVGIYQRIKDSEAKRLRDRLAAIETELDQSKDRARARLDVELDRISALKHEIAELTIRLEATRRQAVDTARDEHAP